MVAIADRIVQRRLLVCECKDLSLSVCMVINNVLGIVPSLLLVFVFDEVSVVIEREDVWMKPQVYCVLLFSGVLGMSVGYFGLACQKQMSATSFQVLQNLSKVGVIFVGVELFGDSWKSASRIVGLMLSIAGSSAYGLARSWENAPKQAMITKENYGSAASSSLEKGCVESSVQVPKS